MELKQYQKNVIADLVRFLELLPTVGNVTMTYEKFWNEKNVPVGFGGIDPYRDNIPGVPNICIKVPTGGGKTFIAASSVKPIFDSLPMVRCKAVVWLVPSDAILEQTMKALSDTNHPYRQRLDVDFGHRACVYSKQQLLNGQNFNPTTVIDQLSVFVLSYDSFRTKSKEGRKAYQENGNLALFAKAMGDASILLADTDETALIQVIRSLNPVIIVDESHHATSDLSKEMLTNFNPGFILDLTATPKKDSNIISYVDAFQLKIENMVKLPVIVYNRKSQTDVLADAVNIRNKLELQAKNDQQITGKYIRPIVLFQAQPKNNSDSTTFGILKTKLVAAGIPEEEIAIKTAEKNELAKIDLLSEDCKIRYIITVNALKEGWDCPFAYVLATIANRTSEVDVEQILGRILRLPYTRKNPNKVLNMSYVITSSNDFHETLDRIVAGLNHAGFSDKDYRIGSSEDAMQNDVPCKNDPYDLSALEQISFDSTAESDGFDIDAEIAKRQIASVGYYVNTDSSVDISGDELFTAAISQADTYEEMAEAVTLAGEDMVPSELKDKIPEYRMNAEYTSEISRIRLPQFFIEAPPSLFVESNVTKLTSEKLADGFRLSSKDVDIDFSALDAEIAYVDVRDTAGGLPKAWQMSGDANKLFRDWFDSQPPEFRIRQCKDNIFGQLSKINSISDAEIKEYVGRVVDGMSTEQIDDALQSPHRYIARIKEKIKVLTDEYKRENFKILVEQGKISVQPNYSFPAAISPLHVTATIGKTLYTHEEEMNGLERDVAWGIANLPNIKWWHRNISRSGFEINGYVNAYPDIIAMTTSNRILMIEPKGDHLENTESRHKSEIGRIWQNKADDQYRYYMVFRTKKLDYEGAVHFDKFMDIVKEL